MGKTLATDKEAGLTDRQERFCREYVANGAHGKAAAIAAGYSAKSAETQAADMLALPKISDEIRRRTEIAAGPLDMSAEEIVQEASRIARVRVNQVVTFGPGGVNPLSSDEMSEDVLAAVSEVSQTVSAEGGSIRVKLHDKLAALTLLAKLKGLLRDKVELTMPWAKELAAMTADELRARADALRAAREKG
jgi:phage terminase small subunit